MELEEVVNREFIVCSAVWYKDGQKHEQQPNNIESGFVVSGRRHKDCYATVSALVGLDRTIELKLVNMENTMGIDDFRDRQGFITSLNRFVNRKEAWKIAKDNNQIAFGYKISDRGEESILISENLY